MSQVARQDRGSPDLVPPPMSEIGCPSRTWRDWSSRIGGAGIAWHARPRPKCETQPIDRRLSEELGVDYGGHNMATNTAGVLVAECMRH